MINDSRILETLLGLISESRSNPFERRLTLFDLNLLRVCLCLRKIAGGSTSVSISIELICTTGITRFPRVQVILDKNENIRVQRVESLKFNCTNYSLSINSRHARILCQSTQLPGHLRTLWCPNGNCGPFFSFSCGLIICGGCVGEFPCHHLMVRIKTLW